MSTQFVKVPERFLRADRGGRFQHALLLFLRMCTLADWQTGVVEGWTDATAAEILGIPLTTLRKQRTFLERIGAISWVKHSHNLTIQIADWGDPDGVHVGARVTANGDSPSAVSHRLSDRPTNRQAVSHHQYSEERTKNSAPRAHLNGKAPRKPFAVRRES